MASPHRHSSNMLVHQWQLTTSNYGNQFDHPRQEIKDLLYKNNVRLFTTKTGDVIVKSTGSHTGEYEVINLKANSTEVSSRYTGSARKCQFLKNNQDTLRIDAPHTTEAQAVEF